MALVLNEEQRMLKDSARGFLAENAPIEALRKLRDSRDEQGYSTELWEKIVNEQGWSGIAIPEEFGGLDFGLLGLGVIFEEAGKTLSASPLLSAIVLGGSTIQLLGSQAQKQQLLPEIIAGELRFALALEEGPQHSPYAIQTTAEKTANGFTLNGKKTFVIDGSNANKLLVVARSDNNSQGAQGISVFMVDTNAKGVNIDYTLLMDSRNAANISFENVEVGEDALVGELHQAYPALDDVLDRGRAILAAEMLGASLEMFQRTMEYLKEREQFGVKIGSFQALKHRASKMFIEIELSKSVVLEALTAIDENRDNRAQRVSLAKAKLNDTLQLVTDEAVQMHGGIGVTDELDVGLFLKRARTQTALLGNSVFHHDRYASLNGF